MGIASCCIDKSIFEVADYINIVSIITNIILTIWIITNIQDKSNNKRFLKDHYINEIKDLKNDYKMHLSNLYNCKVSPKTIIPWFKLMNIKVNDVMDEIHCNYGISEDFLNSYQNELRDLLTDNEDFNNQFNDEKLIFSASSKNSIIKFQQENNKLFNQIILKINNC
jgi:hypothetical protein